VTYDRLWFCPVTLVSDYHDIAEILLKVALNTINQPNHEQPTKYLRSPGSKLLSITTQLHCGGHLSGKAQLQDTILQEDHPMTIPSKFGFN
jgi:hypothetical protein